MIKRRVPFRATLPRSFSLCLARRVLDSRVCLRRRVSRGEDVRADGDEARHEDLRLVVLGVDHGELVEVPELGVEGVEDGGSRGGGDRNLRRERRVEGRELVHREAGGEDGHRESAHPESKHGGRGRLEELRGHLVRREEHLEAVHAEDEAIRRDELGGGDGGHREEGRWM